MNLGTRAGFDRAVALLAAQLRRATGRADVDAIARRSPSSTSTGRTTATERRRLVSEAMAAAGRATIDRARASGAVQRRRQEVVAATRTDARRGQRLAIGAEFNAVDRRVVAT